MKLLIVDVSGLFYAAWFATANRPIGEAFGIVIGQVRGLMQSQDYARVAVAVDSSKRNFRKDIAEFYKANRDAPDKMLLGQLREVIDQLDRDGAHVFEVDHHEADDVIASLVNWARNEGAFPEVHILSSDKDFAQLVHDAKGDQEVSVALWRPNDNMLYRRGDVLKKWGVPPEAFADYLALTGDSVDNIPGVKGVGPKKAVALLTKFSDLAGISYAAFREATKFTPALMTNLRESCDEEGNVAALARQLVTLREDALAPGDCATLLKEKATVETNEGPSSFDDTEQFSGDDESVGPTSDAPTVESSDESEPITGATDKSSITPDAFTVDAEAVVVELNPTPEAKKKPNGKPAAMVPFDKELEPRTPNQAFHLAEHVFNSRLFSAYGNKQAVFIAILMGRSLGLDAMTSLRGMHIIKGRPTLSAQLIMGLVLNSGKADYFQLTESADDKATYTTHRKGDPHPVTMSFTIGDAERANLIGKPDSNWTKYPRTMLRWRAVTELARAVYPDVVANCYSPDELDVEIALATTE